MEKEEPKKENLESLPSWLWVVLIGICVIILILGGIHSWNKNNDDSANDTGVKKSSENIATTSESPDVFIETYPLNKGSSKIRVYTHPGYTYERYSGGWKYWCVPKDMPRTLRGDGNRKDEKMVEYFDLEFYEVECTIDIIFKKIK